MSSFEYVLNQIISFNHAWKRAQESFTDKSPVTIALRNRKSSLQARLLRSYPDECYLKLDDENVEGEELFSVRLNMPVRLASGLVRNDAEHLPVRLAEELFSKDELKKLIK